MKNKRFEGRVKFGNFSSLRKLARAMRRGMLEPEHEFVVKGALVNANRRSIVWRHSHQKGWHSHGRS